MHLFMQRLELPIFEKKVSLGLISTAVSLEQLSLSHFCTSFSQKELGPSLVLTNKIALIVSILVKTQF
jgi:hypothetical protein